MIKVIMQINNFFLCDKNSADTKIQVRNFFANKDVSFIDRADNVFQNDLRKSFKDAIARLNQLLAVIAFREIRLQIAPFLFT